MNKSKKKTKNLILAPDPEQSLKIFIMNLNAVASPGRVFLDGRWQSVLVDRKVFRDALRTMVSLWLTSEKNLNILFRADRSLAKKLHTFRVQLVPDRDGSPRLSVLTAPQGDGTNHVSDITLALFLDFLLNPLCGSLGGPCKECGNYYYKKRRHNLAYCPGKCGSRFTARLANRNRYQDERQNKLKQAQIFFEKWNATSRNEDLRDYVSRKACVSKKFLTIATFSGELDTPNMKDSQHGPKLKRNGDKL